MAEYKPITPPTYVSPLAAGINFEFVSAFTIYEKIYVDSYLTLYLYYKQVVSYNGNPVWENTYIIANDTNTTPTAMFGSKDIPFNENLKSGTYQVYYEIGKYERTPESYLKYNGAKYTFKVVENTLPLKKWTITAVINRLLDLCEPIRKGEKPRFRLNGMRSDGTIITEENKQEGEEVGQAAKFETILSPQLAFTKNTLRECLQEVGKVIHGEPRLIPKKDENGWYFEVSYDMYGRGRMSDISKHKPYLITTTHAIEEFCSTLDSSAENLINTLDKYSGVITEPYRDGSRTVRTESLYVRVTDTNMLIETKYPIYSVDKLEYIGTDGDVDITAYLFETSEYNRLSSYSTTYPDAKLYALRYTLGSKNIDGLNFKRENAVADFAPFGDYSIVEIIREASGNSEFSIDEKKYPEMKFRVTYTPIYNTRVAQTKPYYKDVRYPAGLFFNQQSNLVETKYYGENMKGAVARLGNVEKAISYILFNVYSIPHAGDMFDEEYMISAVAVEWQTTYIKCTIALTKSFNRISQYIGVSSVKRFSEISEEQAVERNVLYREYVVIGDAEEQDDSRIGNSFMDTLRAEFEQAPARQNAISCVAAWGTSYKGAPTPAVLLPVVSSAFGNSVAFSWRYEDNYSAGTIVTPQETKVGNDTVTGYFQNAYRYTDSYGKIYYYHFDLRTEGINGVSPNKLPALADNLIPKVSSNYFSTIGQEPYNLRKDNREALQINVQVDFVTNRKDFIIGSALASYCGAVRGINGTLGAKLYVFDEPLDKFVNHLEGSVSVSLNDLPSSDITVTGAENGFVVSGSFPANGKAWAIVTAQTFGAPKQVEDEQGTQSTEREVIGGDVLLAQNIEVSAGQQLSPIYFTPRREVFDKTVWQDRR